MSAIFISHSSTDRHLASDLHARLRDKGYRSVFLDQDRDDGILPGDKWETELYRELRSCQLVIALVGDNWLRSQWCFAEATHAREKGKTIVGLMLQSPTDCSLLADSQLIDFTLERREEGYERLWSALGKVLDWRAHLAWDAGRPPYPGLDAFEEQDAPVYFGRD